MAAAVQDGVTGVRSACQRAVRAPIDGVASGYRNLERTLARVPPVRMLMAVPETGAFVGRTLLRRRRSEPIPGLPSTPLTPALVAQVAMDEAILMAFVGPDRLPRRADYERVGAEVTAAEARYRAEGWLDDPRALHPAPPPLDDPQRSGGWANGQRYERLVWESGWEPPAGAPGSERWRSYATNRLAGAWMLRHEDDRPRPWVVCVHGYGMGYAFSDLPAFHAVHLHKELGVNVVGPTMPLHGRRKVNRMSGDELLGIDLVNTVHGLQQAAWDIRRLIGWVRATQEPTGIGLFGVSLGGYTVSLVAGLEDGLDAVIAGIPVIDFPALFRTQSPAHVVARSIEHEILDGPGEALATTISPLSFPCRVPHAGRFVFAGLGDRMAHPRQAHQLWEHWEEPAVHWYPGNHVGYLWSGGVWRFVDEALRSRGLAAEPAAAAGAA